MTTRTMVCICSGCGEWIFEGDPMADLKVFKFGELDEINLAHKGCAVKMNAANPDQQQWDYGQLTPRANAR